MKKAMLMTMSGIGEYSALLILREIGDIKRFKKAKELVSYAGLCPGIYQSGNTERTEINHAVNKWLKWIMYECSGRASMLNQKFQSYFYKTRRKRIQNRKKSCCKKNGNDHLAHAHKGETLQDGIIASRSFRDKKAF